MLNKVILTGRLTAQPALKTTQSGVSVVSFSLAVQRNYKDAQGSYPTDFITCVAWRNTAEFICNNIGKGDMLTVVGELQSRRYTDGEGAKRTAIEVNVSEAMFGGSKRDSSERETVDVTELPGGNDMDFESIEDGELPF